MSFEQILFKLESIQFAILKIHTLILGKMFININLPFIVIFIKFFWITDAVVEYYYGYYPYIYGSNVNAAYRYPYGYYGTYNYNYLSSYLNNFYANSKNLSPTLQS